MKLRPLPSLNFLFGLYIILHLIAPFFSIGAYHPDEHFQILEFMHARLGFSSLDALPWEYSAKMRSWWLPFLLSPWELIGRKLLNLSPFHLEIFYRLMASLFSGGALIYYIRRLYLDQSDAYNKSLFYILFSLWFLPFLHARLSPEVVGTSLFLLTLAFFSSKKENTALFGLHQNFYLGLIFSIVFFIRFHFAFFIAGWYLHRLFISKDRSLNSNLTLALGFIAGCGLSVLVDYWGYGTFTFSPYNYFYQNVVMSKASNYGVTPWWDYFKQIIAKGPAPFGVLYILSFAVMFWNFPKSLISWMTVPFFIAHLFVGHKELRFLFPMAPFLILAIERFTSTTPVQRIKPRLKYFLVGLYFIFNFILLLPSTFNSVQRDLPFLKYFFSLEVKPAKVYISSGENPFRLANLEYRYYGSYQGKTELYSSIESALPQVESAQDFYGLFLDRYWKYEIVQKSGRCTLQYFSPFGYFFQFLPVKIRKKSRYLSYWHCTGNESGDSTK